MKREIPTISMRLPVRTRKILRSIARRLGKNKTDALVEIVDQYALDLFHVDWMLILKDKFDSEGFCKSDIAGVCIRKGNVKLDERKRFCVENCSYP